MTLVGCALWAVAGFGMLALLLPDAALASGGHLALAAGSALLALAFGRLQFEFRHGAERFTLAPDAGFLVLAAIVLSPAWSAAVAILAAAPVIRRAESHLERGLLAATALLAGGVSSTIAHALVADTMNPRLVLPAAACAAATRACLWMVGHLLLAEARRPGGSREFVREVPIRPIMILEAGLPTLAVCMAGPFLGLPPAALVVLLAAQVLTWRIVRLLHEQHSGRQATHQLLDTFQRFVPQHVATGILAGSGEHALELSGEQRDLTVMFVDIRGFTGWAERTPPAEVLAELNLLLGELAEAILATDGTVDKFTGDGLMAFWGAPGEQPDHATRAVQSLPGMLMRMRELNIRREVQRSVPLEIGIGIASGPAVVGNVGHRDRLSYTALGDTVNLAARLEKATRQHGVPALLAESTFLALPLSVQRQLQRLDSIEVKGRRDRVRLFAPAALVRHRDARDAA